MVQAAGTTLQGGLVKRSDEAAATPEDSTRYLAELAGVTPGDRVLDAGCGVGGPAMAIARAVPDVVIDGVTVSEVQAVLARELIAEAGLADRVRVHVADFHQLPFREGTFDVALYLEVTGYAPDRNSLYRESARVLRPGGTIYVKEVFRPEDPLTETQRLSVAAFDELWACRVPTLSETTDGMRAAGFVDIRAREYPFVSMEHFYESMVSRDAGGIRLNEFGQAFLHIFADFPAFFGEVKAHCQA
jgi:ubiquinone/menaquinone biosynthesis C-methylase UbiE